MIRNRIYYFLKPVLPWRFRLTLRRWRANRRRRLFSDVWPIDPRSAQVPATWPGWPEGKQFAFVLTHDVEGPRGLSRLPQLMEVERKFGFRSCFNFVPEGDYRVSEDVVEMLRAAGFEVGVHGLKHDGKLYSSKHEFAERAERIRVYASKWKARGFRSPLMQHNLQWIHALKVDYDSSTFDTDPFEPEPDGFETIFPFWVPAAEGQGYVELPYTLVQDLNLFQVLRESDIKVWKEKVDWIARHGGMVLLNTHPDYMCFGGERQRDEYPVARYEELLRYIRDTYDGALWHALPRAVSRYYRDAVPEEKRNTRRKICMVAYSEYEVDNRIRRYAETLAKRGDHVDVIAISGENVECQGSEISGVRVYRLQHRRQDEQNKWVYMLRALAFLVRSSFALVRLQKRNRYDVVHIHNMPDFLAFSAWYPKLNGAKLILDIHDVVPELFVSKFRTPFAKVYKWFLTAVEGASARFVDHVIVSNDLWREKIATRSARDNQISVFLNHVDPEVFSRHQRTRKDDRFIVLFPGSLQWHQGLDIAIKAFSQVKCQVPNAEFHIYSGAGGHLRDELIELAEALGLGNSVVFHSGVPLDQIAQVIANADLGVVPKRADSFGDEAYSTKIMEFMSQGVPVVVSRTKIDSYYFRGGIVHFFESGNADAMARAMLDVINDKQLRAHLISSAYEYVERNNWDRKKKQYLDLVDSLSTENFDEGRLKVHKLGTLPEDGVSMTPSVKTGENCREKAKVPIPVSTTKT